MTDLLSPTRLATTHLVLSGLVLLWNVAMAGRIAGRHDTPRLLAALSGAGGLLVAPALFVALAAGSLLSGRALYTIAWIWPVTAWIIAIQAMSAVGLRRTAFPIGFTIAAYDLLLAVIYTVRYVVYTGDVPSDAMIGLAAAEIGASSVTAHPLAIVLPYYLHVPILAPASAGRPGLGTVLRSAVAVVAGAWTATIVGAVLVSVQAVRSYASFDAERLTEREAADFLVGVKVFPTLRGPPAALSLASDAALADSLGAEAVTIYLAPDAATNQGLDTLARAIESVRAERRLVVALDLAAGPAPPEGSDRSRWLASRVQDVGRIARQLRPDAIVPVVDPYGAARRTLGVIEPDEWERYHQRAADVARTAPGNPEVLVHVGGFSPQDSTLFAWALRPDVPVAGAAITLRPWYSGATALRGRMDAADRWLAAAAPQKPVWVLEAAGFPSVHGDPSLTRALWGSLAWATRRPAIKTFIIFEASDYAAAMGVRAPSGRVRPAAAMLERAIRELGEGTGG